MRATFINTLIEEAKKNPNVFLVTADMGFSVLEPFAEELPNQFLNSGIAEQNSVGLAAGLAMSGKIVYVYSIIPFITMRCFEQVRLELAYQETNVRLVGVGAGFQYGAQGATHHAMEDIAIMRSLANMTVCCPGDNHEAEAIVRQSIDHQGPMYIRIGKNKEAFIHDTNTEIKIGKAAVVKEGQDLAIITTSNMLVTGMNYTKELEAQGLNPMLASIHTVKPIDKEFILDLIDKDYAIVSLEEHNIIGGLGSAISEIIAESGKAVKFKRIGVPDTYSHSVGNQDFLREKFGLTNQDLSQFAKHQ